MNPQYDIVIVGAGVVGCAIAFELSRYEVKVALLDSNNDVGAATSKANSAILHTGYDSKPKSIEASLVARGYRRFRELSSCLGLPIEEVGGLLVAWTEEQLRELPAIIKKGKKNGVTNLSFVPREEIYRLEPNLGSGALGGVHIPDESITCPFTVPLAFATNAVINGVDWLGATTLENVYQRNGTSHTLVTNKGTIQCKLLINAAGLFSDEVDRMLGFDRFAITPRRGEFIVFDKHARRLLSHIILPVPTGKTKGVLIAPTIFGNVLLGPTADDIPDKRDTATTAIGLGTLMEKGKHIMPRLLEMPTIATYAGLRAASEHNDYQLYFEPQKSYICVGGIRSTGLTSALGIAEAVAEQVPGCGIALKEKYNWVTQRMPNIAEAFERPSRSAEKVKEHPDFGRIICHCEQVSLREIQLACEGPLPAVALDGIRRRTRAMMGRCQGFHCCANIIELCAKWMKKSPESLLGLDEVKNGWTGPRIGM